MLPAESMPARMSYMIAGAKCVQPCSSQRIICMRAGLPIAFETIAADSAVSNATQPLPNEPEPSKKSTRMFCAGIGESTFVRSVTRL